MNSKKNSCRGNYMRKYGNCEFSIFKTMSIWQKVKLSFNSRFFLQNIGGELFFKKCLLLLQVCKLLFFKQLVNNFGNISMSKYENNLDNFQIMGSGAKGNL